MLQGEAPEDFFICWDLQGLVTRKTKKRHFGFWKELSEGQSLKSEAGPV